IPLHDLRNEEVSCTLDEHGFKFIRHGQTFEEFGNGELIEKEYIPQVENVILDNVPGAERVFVFDWRVRLPWPSPWLD
ncbi:hypothetical protein B0T26DRAFT_644479, partial [Lasiosphaeria miniovina]